jgi:hypothetical protein
MQRLAKVQTTNLSFQLHDENFLHQNGDPFFKVKIGKLGKEHLGDVRVFDSQLAMTFIIAY